MIPAVTGQQIEEALLNFDQNYRTTPEFSSWELNQANIWAIEFQGKKYPPKKIISIAASIPTSSFSGGKESNDFLTTLGFSIIKIRDSSLREILIQISKRYPEFSNREPFAGKHEIYELLNQAKKEIESSKAVTSRSNIRVKSSYGQGVWAAVPWISLLDLRETKTTQDGTYPVYIFHENGAGISLKFGQGVSKIQKEYGSKAAEILKTRAAEIRQNCLDLAEFNFDLSGTTETRDKSKKAILYEASTIASKHYSLDSMPSDEELFADLEILLQKYNSFVESNPKAVENAKPQEHPVALIGTWRDALSDFSAVSELIQKNGHWASPWSFPIKDAAIEKLQVPFNLYASAGQGNLVAKLRVDEYETSKGKQGIQSPWPGITDNEYLDKTKTGDRQTDILKTWFKIGAIEKIEPSIPFKSFSPAPGLSTDKNVLNQNSFGYVIDSQLPSTRFAPDIVQPSPLPIEWLVQRTGLPQSLLNEMVESILGSSPQIILAGPPGTSKTWVARQLADFLTRNRKDQIRFVQFHPNYGYESFIEGLRPVTKSGGVSFELTPGVVKETVNSMERLSAINSDGNEFVIVIDEANRANLPRVLGELMFLFEYRNDHAILQYSGKFSLPKNLRFIATMNTADRSIRSIDTALRRRFEVFELTPDSEILKKYHSDNNTIVADDLINGFEALNEKLMLHLDRHHTIGHAFFMQQNMSASKITQVWKRKVFPLIEEFFFDRPEILDEYSLEKFWPSTQRNA